jgi:hypothetical protein
LLEADVLRGSYGLRSRTGIERRPAIGAGHGEAEISERAERGKL